MVKKRNYLDHLEFCLLKRPGFDSSQDRFQQNREEPEVKIPIGKVMPVPTKPITQSSVFKSREARKLFEAKSKAPPIGSYEQLPLTRKSFNTRYQSKKDMSVSRSSLSSKKAVTKGPTKNRL